MHGAGSVTGITAWSPGEPKRGWKMATKKLLWLAVSVLMCLCITPRGLAVCCLPDGSCSAQGQVACENAGGCFLGSTNDCSEVICQAHDYFFQLDSGSALLVFNKF